MKEFLLECAAELCIHNENKTCHLEMPPDINAMGMCECYRYVSIDEAILNDTKKREQKKIIARQKERERHAPLRF